MAQSTKAVVTKPMKASTSGNTFVKKGESDGMRDGVRGASWSGSG